MEKKQAPAQGVVTEAMVERAERIWMANDGTFSERMRLVLAALSAPEPAAQGDAVAHRLLKDALFACIAAGLDRAVYGGVAYKDGGAKIVFSIETPTAPPAQPERVPLPWPAPFEVVQKWALENGYNGATDDQACAAYRKAHPQPAERVPEGIAEQVDELLRECRFIANKINKSEGEDYLSMSASLLTILNTALSPRRGFKWLPDATPAAPAEGGKGQHKWDRDGERCVVCGDKDWMGGPCNGPRTATGAAR